MPSRSPQLSPVSGYDLVHSGAPENGNAPSLISSHGNRDRSNERISADYRQVSPVRSISPAPPPSQNKEITGVSNETQSGLKFNGQQLLGKDNWIWEIASLGLSALCLVAIVVILVNFQNIPLSKWHTSIAPNTVISVLSTVSKASLLFSVAECISQLKWLHFNRAHKLSDIDLYDNASRGPVGSLFYLLGVPVSFGALGAIITIIALALDPFAQQLVSFPSRQVAMGNNSASFRTAQLYNSGVAYNQYNTRVGFTDFGMQGAIFSGLFDSVQPPAVNCPTSNCTWPDTYSQPSLGVIGQCRNVTAAVDNHCDEDFNTRAKTCNITSPGGFELNSQRTHQSATFKFTLLNATTITSANTSDADLTQFAVWRALEVGNLDRFEVIECKLTLAVYFYTNISVTKNDLHIQSQPSVPLEPVGPLTSGLNAFKPIGDQFPPQMQFQVHAADMGASAQLFREIFTAESTFPFGTETGIVPDVLSKGNLSRITDNIALGMTEHIRTGPNSTGFDGVAYQAETYIHVKWPWLVLPVALVVGAAIFLVCSILLNFRQRGVLWKSSSLALLLHSVEGVTGRGFGKDDTPLAGVDALAQKTRVFQSDGMEFKLEK